MLNINKTKEGSKLNITVEGRLDTTTAPELEAVIRDEINGVTELVIDLDKLEYISSAGLRVLLAAQKALSKKGGHVTITNCSPEVREVFTMTGFADILEIL